MSLKINGTTAGIATATDCQAAMKRLSLLGAGAASAGLIKGIWALQKIVVKIQILRFHTSYVTMG